MAERALRNASVTAPFDGLIGRRHVSRGEFVSPGQSLFELVALQPIEVEFHLPEIDSGRVARGQRVAVRVAPHPDERFDALVTVVSPTIDERTRTLRVKAELENADGRLRPGLFARVDLGIATRQGVLLIPEEAVLQRADGAVVFRLDNGTPNAENRVERLIVETGLYRKGQVEVVKGLRAGDRIIQRGHASLVDGEVVIPRNADGTLASPPIPDVARDTRDGSG